MKRTDKIFVTVLGLLMFFVSGGIACTYVTGVNLILVGILGVLIFVAAGYVACTVGNNRIEKRKASQGSTKI